jgi:hypothetical protein
MERELVFFDNGRFQDWQKGVAATVGKANNLIQLWNKTQQWHRVKTRDEFISLIDDPAGRLDAELSKNVNLDLFGKVKPNLDKIAEFVNIDRPAWQVTCKSFDTISLDKFLQVERFTNFENGWFRMNPLALEKKKADYSVFAETEREQANLKHLRDLVGILNDHLKKGYISTNNMQVVCNSLELQYAGNTVYGNDFRFASLIKLQ